MIPNMTTLPREPMSAAEFVAWESRQEPSDGRASFLYFASFDLALDLDELYGECGGTEWA